ncbi:MAG: BrxE family protein [Lutibacter sp.]|jgi:hypothetical protein|nr:BrxE family protein [Lutibacter sp.]
MDINKISLLRKLVLLGFEENNWYNQKVLTNYSDTFLGYILPKTKIKASFNLANRIACLEHDQNIKGNRIHLFRLPQNTEILLDTISYDFSVGNIIDELSKIASNIAVETNQGAFNIGSVNELQSEYIIQVFAKQYLEAFKGGYKTYPYLQ